ncbi:MAG TPA: NAD-dependent epimerase/dehydratase family protein [Chloroflexi bacterium]|nr:NAD-dependent epimerase/dehydratase family protein [Chloroflexota bacterium]
MKILVTGAAGFIGSHLSERLSDLGHTVVGLDCLNDNYTTALKKLNVDDLANKGVDVLPLDLSADDLSAAVEGVEIVYHAAAQPGISASVSFQTYVENNVTATYRLIEALRSSDTLRAMVNISTSSVYGFEATQDETAETKPASYYGVTKLAAEQLALAHHRDQGFPACSTRLYSVYGPRERPEKLYPKLIGCILEDRAFPLFEGSEHHLRSYTYVGDIVDGLVAVMDNLDRCIGEIFNIGSDTAITTGEGIQTVEEIIGRQARIDHRPRRPGDQLKTHAKIDKARRVLGYNPSTPVEEGLRTTVTWYEERILGKIDLWPERLV